MVAGLPKVRRYQVRLPLSAVNFKLPTKCWDFLFSGDIITEATTYGSDSDVSCLAEVIPFFQNSKMENGINPFVNHARVS